jgi:hypothetical protein
MRINILPGVVLSAALAGCGPAALMKTFFPPQDESNAKEYMELLRQRKLDQIERDL